MKIILKYVLILLYIFNTNVHGISQSKIDNIQSPKDLQRFIWEIFPVDKQLYQEREQEKKELLEIYPENYESIIGLSDFEKRCKALYQIKNTPFIKIDFDRNGKTDLLVLKYEYENPSPFLVLDLGNKFERLSIPYKGFDNCFYPIIDTIQNRTCILNYNCFDILSTKTPSCKIDTLVLFNKALIEFASPSKHTINQITFKISSAHCVGCDYDEFEIVINSDFTTKFKVNYQDSSYTASSISKSDFSYLEEILNVINFPKLKKHYSNWVSHAISVNVKIIYNDNEVKEIYDYGMDGTPGLIEIYSFIESLYFELKKQNKP